jgi:hypothetical protein
MMSYTVSGKPACSKWEAIGRPTTKTVKPSRQYQSYDRSSAVIHPPMWLRQRCSNWRNCERVRPSLLSNPGPGYS